MHCKSFLVAACCAVILSATAQAQKPVTTPGGTVNVVPKYSGSATIVNSAIFEKSGKVGLGTSNPAVYLDLTGRQNCRPRLISWSTASRTRFTDSPWPRQASPPGIR